MRSHGVGLAHVGKKRRNNEDCWLADDQFGLYLVADGMGGHSAGDVAAATAVDAAAKTIRAQRELIERVSAGDVPARDLMPVVDAAFQTATRAVHDLAAQDPLKTGMGCTLTLLLVAGTRGIMGHVGDSRLYLCRRGATHQLSQDQSIAAELAREGVIAWEKVRTHPFRNQLSQCIGKPTVRPEFLRFELVPGDRMLLCSDGFSNYVTDPTWLTGQLAEEDLEGIPEELVRFANDAGGSDNITAVVVEADPEPSDDMLAAAASVQARMKAVSSCFLCQDLSWVRQARVVSYCRITEHPPGAVVATAGEPLPGLVLLVSGELALWRDGKQINKLVAGQHFGASALTLPRASRLKVTASGQASTLTLTTEALKALSRRRPRLGTILQRRLAQELARALEERLDSEPRPAAALAP